VIADRHGIPLALSRTGGSRNDVTQLMPLLRGIPPVRGRRGRPRRRPQALHADRGYDHDTYRRMAWATGVKPAAARRGVADGSGLGTHRRVIEQTIALLHWFRRLRTRWEIRDDIHQAFMTLAAAIICWRHLTR
jgi:Transposase DDE domain